MPVDGPGAQGRPLKWYFNLTFLLKNVSKRERRYLLFANPSSFNILPLTSYSFFVIFKNSSPEA